LVGRGLRRRPDADSIYYADSHPLTITDANSDSNADSNPVAGADSNAYTGAVIHSDADSEPHAHGDSDSATYSNPHAFAFAYSDPYAGADGRGDDTSTGHGRHFLSRIIGAERGDAAYLVYVSAGALPRGLAPNTFSGEISGTPGFAGTSKFTIYATDRGHESVSRAFQILVLP
jgi:Putative Ig domain